MDFSKKTNHVNLLQALVQQWPDVLCGDCTVEVALSGGLDSVVLFDLLVKASTHIGFILQAVHVHHGLSPHADAWVNHCQALCDTHQVPLRVVRVKVTKQGCGLEAASRHARYNVFCQSKAQAVVLAHHADDQVETFFLHLLRGGGVQALSAMLPWRSLTNEIGLWRPLLGMTRAQLVDYADSRQLSWINDESNADVSYRRNWLRHMILPAIASHLPDYRHHVKCCMEKMTEASLVLDEVVAQDEAECLKNGRLQLSVWRTLSLLRQQQLLLRWVQHCQLGTPTRVSLKAFLYQLHTAKTDSVPTWHLPQGNVYRYRGELWCERLMVFNGERILIKNTEEITLPQWGGFLRWKKVDKGLSNELLSQGLWLDLPLPGTKLKATVGHQSFKTLFQTAGIPPFLRRRWPVLLDAEQYCVALPSIGIASDRVVKNGLWPEWVTA